jgi:mannosylglycerate hydrolase
VLVSPDSLPPEAPPQAAEGAPQRLLCVVSHTHWDREWYLPAARFRVRLLALVDAILAESDHAPFLLDGQAIVLEDYLAWRPDRLREVQEALRTGRIEAGPWYVLADNLIVSGEAIIRNLEAGARSLAALGAKAPPVAWCPDSFGHPAAMPVIARGFGLDVGVVWRGLGGPSHPAGDSLTWLGPDGSALPIWHLPRDGYEYGSALPVPSHAAQQRWQQLRHDAIARARTSVVLLTNGADHHARQRDLREALKALREAAAADGVDVQAMGLSDWAQRFAGAARQTSLPAVQGELRNSSGHTWSLGGTLATRAHQKRRNARLERGLLRDVEPWLALVRLHAGPGALATPYRDARLSMAQLPSVLARAWETVLRTHPHDTLCGCSVDEVARQMDARQDEASAMGQELRHAALCLLLPHDVVAARALRDFDWRRVVLRNRAPRPRGGVARVRLIHHLADEAVGPGSAAMPGAPGDHVASDVDTLRVDGMVQQVLRRRRQRVRRESPQHYPDNDWALVQDTLIWVPPLPAGGLQVYDARTLSDTQGPPIAPHDPVWARRAKAKSAGREYMIGNARARCTVRNTADGYAQVSWQVDDRTLGDALWIETREDVGDSYTPAPRGVAERLRCTGVRVVAEGPLRATLRLDCRTASAPHIRVHLDLTLDADSTLLQLAVHGHVQRPDQRLQLVMQSDVTQAQVWADAALGPVKRMHEPQAESGLVEAVPPGMPMHRWASVSNAMQGFTCIADGLAEMETRVHDGHAARLALTLVRGTGALSRANLPERPGHAGWPADIPEAQCLGPFAARAALMLHGPMNDDTLARVRDACDDVLLPLVGESWPDLDTTHIPPRLAGVALSGEAFEQSAVTLSAREPDAVVLRAVNLTARHAMGAWQLPDAGPWLVTPCRLDETPVAESYLSSGQVLLDAGPREVLTVRVCRVAHSTTHQAPSPPPR